MTAANPACLSGSLLSQSRSCSDATSLSFLSATSTTPAPLSREARSTSCRSSTATSTQGPRVVARFGGGPPGGGGAWRGGGAGGRPKQQQKGGGDEEGALINSNIRALTVRLLDDDNSPLGIMSREEALAAAQQSNLDLVLIAPDADPPVARIMNFGKFRYDQQKKKREQLRKSAANRQEIKELKMRYNIDIADYNVRLKQALRFLKEGDKVKVSAQFRGREMEFKELGRQLFDRFVKDTAEVALVESKPQMEGRTMLMVLIPNKAILAKAAATQKKQQPKEAKARPGGVNGGVTVVSTEASDEDDLIDDSEEESEESEEGEGEHEGNGAAIQEQLVGTFAKAGE